MKNSVEVTIAGQRYVLKSEGRSEHLRTLAAYVNGKVEEVRSVARGLSPERLAVLTALNIADELLREREEGRSLRAEVRRRTQLVLTYLRGLGEAHESEVVERAVRERAG